MPAATRNITIEQGADYSEAYKVYSSPGVPWNLTSVTITAKVRSAFGSSGSTVATFTPTKTGAAAGEFTLSLTAVATAALTPSSSIPNTSGTRSVSLGVWDLEFEEGGVTYRILEGTAALSQEATR